MLSHRPLSVLLGAALVVVGAYATPSAPRLEAITAPTDACALLTQQQVSAALEVTSLAGRHPFASITTSCIGDDAYYVLYGSDSPQLMVRKGSAQFSVRILNGLNFKPFTLDQEKAKELALAQAAVKTL